MREPRVGREKPHRTGRPGGAISHERRETAIRRVVAYIALNGWLPTSAYELAEELDFAPETIRKYRLAAEVRIREHWSTTPEPDRADFLRRLRAIEAKATLSEDLKASASLMSLEARVNGWEQAPALPDGQVQVIIATMPAAPASEE